MPIPDLDENGFLPIGVHDAQIEDVQERFGCFQGSDRRVHLFKKLQSYLEEVSAANLAVAVIVDGSFVTAKERPGDIDLILVVRSDHDFAEDLRPFEYNLVSKKRVKAKYDFDLFVAFENGSALGQWIDFFQQVKGQPERSKGLVRVTP